MSKIVEDLNYNDFQVTTEDIEGSKVNSGIKQFHKTPVTKAY